MQRAQTAFETGCAGVICSGLEARQVKEQFGKSFFAPGIRPAWAAAAKEDQQRITTPTQAVNAGADYLVIGRPIRDAADPRQAAVRIAEEIEDAFR